METVPHATKDDVERAVDAPYDAFQGAEWSKIAPGDRANLLLKVASMLEAKADEFAKLESGKSIKQTTTFKDSSIPLTFERTLSKMPNRYRSIRAHHHQKINK